jgi:hypothetical protein
MIYYFEEKLNVNSNLSFLSNEFDKKKKIAKIISFFSRMIYYKIICIKIFIGEISWIGMKFKTFHQI